MKGFAVTLVTVAGLVASTYAAETLEAAGAEGCSTKNVCNYIKDLQKTVSGIYDELDEAFALIEQLQNAKKDTKSGCASKCHKDSVDCKKRCQYNASGGKVLRLTTVRTRRTKIL